MTSITFIFKQNGYHIGIFYQNVCHTAKVMAFYLIQRNDFELFENSYLPCKLYNKGKNFILCSHFVFEQSIFIHFSQEKSIIVGKFVIVSGLCSKFHAGTKANVQFI